MAKFGLSLSVAMLAASAAAAADAPAGESLCKTIDREVFAPVAPNASREITLEGGSPGFACAKTDDQCPKSIAVDVSSTFDMRAAAVLKKQGMPVDPVGHRASWAFARGVVWAPNTPAEHDAPVCYAIGSTRHCSIWAGESATIQSDRGQFTYVGPAGQTTDIEVSTDRVPFYLCQTRPEKTP